MHSCDTQCSPSCDSGGNNLAAIALMVGQGKKLSDKDKMMLLALSEQGDSTAAVIISMMDDKDKPKRRRSKSGKQWSTKHINSVIYGLRWGAQLTKEQVAWLVNELKRRGSPYAKQLTAAGYSHDYVRLGVRISHGDDITAMVGPQLSLPGMGLGGSGTALPFGSPAAEQQAPPPPESDPLEQIPPFRASRLATPETAFAEGMRSGVANAPTYGADREMPAGFITPNPIELRESKPFDEMYLGEVAWLVEWSPVRQYMSTEEVDTAEVLLANLNMALGGEPQVSANTKVRDIRSSYPNELGALQSIIGTVMSRARQELE